ncbi:hypothetical protein JI735_19510 [Paenibacillus sonchi]|uniref:Uncharacterized protein n=1 Tax=Paenibacillus sonchi TaxID=373687 RepID=A0A974P7T1_9BACL|nr:hypothetical protein [Paenibacillus sonchi]QQZ58920.1 hypothetical protein JI735_19510 [Paenibacillus sonchi]
MIGFVWLMLTLGGWVYLYWRLPDCAGFWSWLPVILCLIVYMYGWVLEHRNKLIYFFTGLLWTGMALSGRLHAFLKGQPDSPLSAAAGFHAALIAGLIFSSFITFANSRLQHNLLNRRGNVSKQQLVAVKPTPVDRWKKLKRLFIRSPDIELNLGEEIPMKE